MKTRSFSTYCKSRIGEDNYNKLKIFTHLKYDVAKEVSQFMKDNHIGFNEMVRLTGISQSHLNKILNAESNLTLKSIAKIYAVMKKSPHIVE